MTFFFFNMAPGEREVIVVCCEVMSGANILIFIIIKDLATTSKLLPKDFMYSRSDIGGGQVFNNDQLREVRFQQLEGCRSHHKS